MTELELVLREISQLRTDLKEGLLAERQDREGLDSEISELRMKVDRLERPSGGLKRDGGLVISSATVTALIGALVSWLAASPAPPAAPRAPTASTIQVP